MANKQIITIYRTKGFFNESQDGLDEYLSQSKQSIGSNWASSQNKQIGTGLTPTEIQILLPHLIDLDASDRDFKKAVKEFYESIHTPVDYRTGVELNIALADMDAPLSEKNLPENIMDYVKYKHALQHPEVAHTADDATGNQLYKFYIHNPVDVKKKTSDLREKRDEALAEYLKLTKEKSEDKIDNVLLLFGEDVRLYGDRDSKLEFLSERAKSDKLETLIAFIEKSTDKDIEFKALLAKAVKVSVLKTVGTRYVYVENGQVLAHSQDEAVLNLKDDADLLTSIKALVQDKIKASKK